MLKAKRNFRESKPIPDLYLIFDENVKIMITFVTGKRYDPIEKQVTPFS